MFSFFPFYSSLVPSNLSSENKIRADAFFKSSLMFSLFYNHHFRLVDPMIMRMENMKRIGGIKGFIYGREESNKMSCSKLLTSEKRRQFSV